VRYFNGLRIFALTGKQMPNRTRWGLNSIMPIDILFAGNARSY
jgi:hypothetical protein